MSGAAVEKQRRKCSHENWKSRERKTERGTGYKGTKKKLKSNNGKTACSSSSGGKKKVHICSGELVSEVACGLVPALKLRGKMNTDRERRTGKERKKTKNKCQASIKSES